MESMSVHQSLFPSGIQSSKQVHYKLYMFNLDSLYSLSCFIIQIWHKFLSVHMNCLLKCSNELFYFNRNRLYISWVHSFISWWILSLGKRTFLSLNFRPILRCVPKVCLLSVLTLKFHIVWHFDEFYLLF